MTVNWYAMRVKPHKEQWVAAYLQERDVEVFYPALKVKPVNPRSRRERPYFPGYIFVQVDLEENGPQTFSWIPGARGLISFGEEAAVVTPTLIHELQRHLANVNAKGGLNRTDYQSGEKVRVVSGPFQGYAAIFDTHLPGKERVQILLAFLSSVPQPVKLNITDITKTK
jgi:transcriptional antiterminator RfaH